MKIHVSNLSPDVTEEDLQKTFSAFGRVESLTIAKNRFGVSKGHGFIEMQNKREAQAAIETLKGVNLSGKPMKISEATTRFKIHHSGKRRGASRRNLGDKQGGLRAGGRRH